MLLLQPSSSGMPAAVDRGAFISPTQQGPPGEPQGQQGM